MDTHKNIPLLNGKVVAVSLRFSQKAKKIALRLSPGTNFFELILPEGIRPEAGWRFASQHINWLSKKSSHLGGQRPFADGMEFPFRGKTLSIKVTSSAIRKVEHIGDQLVVWPLGETTNQIVIDWLRFSAQQRFVCLTKIKSAQLKKPIRRLSVRDPKTRWGSCSSRGNLSFSWRLIMAPDFVTDYVAAHETAHLAHMNHSAQFWSVVRELTEHADAGRKWLNQNGKSLHLIGEN
ncbi:MAG: SprT family zinc-dependent metalloprotease [Rhodospirillaceae bacterium]